MSKINRRKFLQDAGLGLASISAMGIRKSFLITSASANTLSTPAVFKFAYYPSYHKLELNVSSIPLEIQERNHDITAIVSRLDNQQEVAQKSFTVTESGGTFFMDLPGLEDGMHQLRVKFGVLGSDVVTTFLHKNFIWIGNDLGKSMTVPSPFEPIRVVDKEAHVVLRTYKMNVFGLCDSIKSEGIEILAESILLHLETDKGKDQWRFGINNWVSTEGHKAVFAAETESDVIKVKTTSSIDYDGCIKVKMDLLPGKSKDKINHLWLEIPLLNKEAPLFHYAILPDIRRNYAGTTPDGGKITWMNQPDDTYPPQWPQGAQPPIWKADPGKEETTIWTCRDTRPWEKLYYTDFVSYIWLGGVSRGVAWFADSPRGFLLDPSGIVQKIVRDENKLTLCVDLINKPGILKAPRSIIFGIQASPTKPMPHNWRSNLAMPALPVGDMVCWGGHECADKYPDDADYRVVDEIIKVRGTGKIDQRIFEKIDQGRSRHFKVMGTHNLIATWLEWVLDAAEINRAFYKENLEAANGVIQGAIMAPFRYHVDGGDPHGLREEQTNPVWKTVSLEKLYPDWITSNIVEAPLCVYFEEHASNIANEEWAVYQDEWRGRRVFATRSEVCDMPDVSNNFDVGRQGVPESYRDFALWFANEWMKRGVSIYIDNIYPKVVDNPVTSEAFIDEEGNLQPSASIWDLREYHKRIWVLEQEWNKKNPPYKIMITHHMTNTLILPIHTWNDVTLDLEWWTPASEKTENRDRDQSEYFPFDPDFLLSETAGLQTGSFRHALRSVASVSPYQIFNKLDPEAIRVEWGMRMVHELSRWLFPYENYAAFEPARFLEKEIWTFGYGTENCEVINYWNNDPRIVVIPEEVKWILLYNKSDKKFLIVLQSYRNENLTADVLIDETKLSFTLNAKAHDIENNSELTMERNKNLHLKISMNGKCSTKVFIIS